MEKYVFYYRVSTQKQGRGGLGLQAQKALVDAFARGGQAVAEFTDIESGKVDARPELLRAIEASKRHGARLVIAKLDRLSRNAAFIHALKDSGVDFVCADMPDANTLTIGIFAAMAQHERETIGRRTREALAAKRARGHRLGSPRNLTDGSREKALRAKRANMLGDRANRQAVHLIRLGRGAGRSYASIAGSLNSLGYRTRRGALFSKASVFQLLRRFDRQGGGQ